MRQRERIKKALAFAIRVGSVPPVMATALVIVLAVCRRDFFASRAEIWATLGFLAFLPLCAYPCAWLIPRVRAKGREGERNLAFLFSGLGYVTGWFYGVCISRNTDLILIYLIYLFSVIGLLICNQVFHRRASGHGCSVTGPLVLIINFLGIKGLVPGVLAYLAILWASVYSKRHTLGQFLGGTSICLTAWVLAWLCIDYIPGLW